MKKLILLLVVLTISASSAMACHERVHVEDQDSNDMNAVEVKISGVDCTGWWATNYKTTDTLSDGWTPWKSVEPFCTYKAEVISGADGYWCDTDTDYNNEDDGEMFITCYEGDVPEFTTIGAGLALLGAGLFGIRKMRR